MSSNGEDIIRETFEKLGDAIGVQMQIPDAMITNLGAVLQAQIDLLAELQSTGRLIPAGGHVLTAEEWANRITLADKQVAVSEAWEQGFEYGSGHKYGAEDDGVRLTAEQVEDVRTAREALRGYRNFEGSISRGHVRSLIAAVDALFPATEPAEDAKPCGSNSVTLGWCKLTARHEGLHTNGTYLWGTPSEPDPPAPSEPAEERCQSVSIFRERCALVPGHDGRSQVEQPHLLAGCPCPHRN